MNQSKMAGTCELLNALKGRYPPAHIVQLCEADAKCKSLDDSIEENKSSIIHLYLKSLKAFKKEGMYLAKTAANAGKDLDLAIHHFQEAAKKLRAIDADFWFLIPFFEKFGKIK